MTWKIDPSYTWHRCDAQGPLCSTDEKLVGDVAELPGGACLVCVKCVNKLVNLRQQRDSLLDQIEHEGCAVAHAGELTYECDATKPCGLCRLRAQRDELKAWKDAAIDSIETNVNRDIRHFVLEGIEERIKETG